mgnify:FL=1
MFGGIFWGTLVTILGISIIIEALFGISLPVFKILLGCWLIYWGLTFILGKDCFKSQCKSGVSSGFSQCDYVNDKNKNFMTYKVLFAQRVIDLRNLDFSQDMVVVKIDSVFSNTIVKINPELKTKIKASSAFSNVELPDRTQVYFGSYAYKTENLKDSKPELKIKINSVFGRVVVEDK